MKITDNHRRFLLKKITSIAAVALVLLLTGVWVTRSWMFHDILSKVSPSGQYRCIVRHRSMWPIKESGEYEFTIIDLSSRSPLVGNAGYHAADSDDSGADYVDIHWAPSQVTVLIRTGFVYGARYSTEYTKGVQNWARADVASKTSG